MAEGHGSVQLNHHLKLEDDKKLRLGSDGDATVSYDGTNMRINPQAKGSGRVKIDAGGLTVAGTTILEEQPSITRIEFDRAPRPLIAKADGAGAATGTAGDENLMMFPNMLLEYHILGTQTIVAPTMTAVGLDLGSMDQTADDGIEVCVGINSTTDQTFTVGTSGAFYFEAKLKVADVSGTDDLAVGFRKKEAYQANVDDYDEMAVLNVISGDIKIETILNGGATTTTDTTDNLADAGTVSLKVLVSAAGVVTYQINDAAPTTTAAFTFDTGEVVVPFIFFLQNTDIAGTVELIHWECGLQ